MRFSALRKRTASASDVRADTLLTRGSTPVFGIALLNRPLYAPRATSSIRGSVPYAIHRARHAPDQQSQMVAPYVLRATTRRLRRHQACAFLAQQVTEWLLEYLDVSIAHATEIACIVLKGGN